MSKHKLFLPDSYSPLNASTSECSTPKNNKNYPTFRTISTTSVQGVRNETNSQDVLGAKEGREKNQCNPAPPHVLDFDSDLVDFDYFSRSAHQKLPYSMQEDELILEFVLKGQNIFKVGSISLWKFLEAKKENPRRTYQSLKNRFLRNIKPYLFTTYKHLVKDQETTDRILAKFPELRKRMGVKDTISNMLLPIRQSQKAQENSHTEYKEDVKRIKAIVGPKPEDIQEPVIQCQPEPLLLNPLNGASICRKVNFSKNSIIVSVNFMDNKCSGASFSPLLKISERFKQLETQRDGFLCSACGRYNSGLRSNDSSESATESDVMIPNSADTNKEALQNIESKKLNSTLKNNLETNLKLLSSENINSNHNSQSLLNRDEEINEIDIHAKDTDDGESEAPPQDTDVIARKKPVKIESSVNVDQVKKKSRTATSKKKTRVRTMKKSGDSDSEIDIIYENAMAGFRKLINKDEEKMLSKKCLYKNRDMIGFNSDSEKNLDSYFLESSPEVETPTFTKNFSTLQNDGSDTDFKSASNSHLASNMMKMLASEK